MERIIWSLITNHADLRTLYGEPLGLAVDKEKSELDEYSQKFLAVSPFAILSTANSIGIQDCSPHGDYSGFIQGHL